MTQLVIACTDGLNSLSSSQWISCKPYLRKAQYTRGGRTALSTTHRGGTFFGRRPP